MGVPELGPGTTRIADWDDVDSAVRVMLPRADLALVRIVPDGESRRIFECISLRDEPALLVVERAAKPEPTVPPAALDEGTAPSELLTIRASIGRFGNPEQERRIVELVSKRLKDLAGVAYAPVR